jgi:hypothetical protein
VRRDGSGVELDQMARDRQTEPEASMRARARTVRLREAVEHRAQEVCVDASTVVGDRQRHVSARFRNGDTDATTRRRKLDRVRQQVPDNLLQPSRVSHH